MEKVMNIAAIRAMIAAFLSGLAMWIVAGLWHNLVLPMFDNSIEAHHEGLGMMLIAYFVLSSLMTYLYVVARKGERPILDGVKIGIVVGVLWVFPHGLTMAAAHNTSILYEVQNAGWHVIEQGTGGVVIALILGRKQQSKGSPN